MDRIEYLTTYLRTIYETHDSKSLMFFDSIDGDTKIRIGIDFLYGNMFVLDSETEYDRIESSKFELDMIYEKDGNE